MTQNQLLKTLKTLVGIFLLSNLSACDGMPKVTVNQLDTVNGVANPFKIVKYDLKKCTVEVKEEAPFPILGPELHGGYCLTAKDFAEYKAYLQAECKTNNETKK